MLAARLSDDPALAVTLLEAGPDLRDDPPAEIRSGWRPCRTFDWGLESEPDGFAAPRALPRGRLLGGCSATNATFALRGSPHDYDRWSAIAGGGWSFEEVLPAFIGLERDLDFGADPWHGEDGPVPIRRYGEDELSPVASAVLAGLGELDLPSVADHNAPGAVGAGPIPVNCVGGVRMSTVLTHLAAVAGRPNLDVRCDSEVAGVVLSAGRAAGVRLADGGTVAAGAVALCAGTYESPALLLRSGIGPAAELRELGIEAIVDLPGVGANLADHPSVSLDLPYRGETPAQPLFQVAATAHSSGATGAASPDLQLLAYGPFPAADGAPATFSCGAALLKPSSRGSVTLRSSEPAARPRVLLRYLAEDDDVDRLVEGLDLVEELAGCEEVRDLVAGEAADVPPPDRAGRRQWARQECWTYHHAVGTCRMGAASDPLAVAGPDGAVHGVDGLYVADASLMPEPPAANTHLPTLMVAERLAGLIGPRLGGV